MSGKREVGDPFYIDNGELGHVYTRHKGEGCFMPKEEWEPLVRRAYNELINRALTVPYSQITVTYSQLGSKIGLVPISEWFHLKIAWILYACATFAFNRGFPMITALVVNSETGQPGKGFWSLDGIPQGLRGSGRRDDITPFKVYGDRDEFWVEELKRIDQWGKRLESLE